MLFHRCNLFLTAFVTLAVLTFVPGQALAENQNTSGAQVVPRKKPVSSIQFYCDAQGGVSVPISHGLNASFHDTNGYGVLINGSWVNPGHQEIGGKLGVNLGGWFNDDPASLLSHFGCNINFSYNRLDFQRRAGSFKAVVTNINIILPGPVSRDEAVGIWDFGSRGDLFSAALLFNYRQGVLLDKQSPFGRLQFYGGLGPALMINRQKFTSINTYTINASGFLVSELPAEQDFGSQVDVSPGLMVQLGANYFFTKNIYMKVSLDYRYFKSAFNLKGNGTTHDNPDPTSQTFSSQLNYDNNLFGINFGFGFQF